jgi:hypothetical protein
MFDVRDSGAGVKLATVPRIVWGLCLGKIQAVLRSGTRLEFNRPKVSSIDRLSVLYHI